MALKNLTISLFQERSQNIHNELEMLKGPYLTEVVFSKLKEDLTKTVQPGEMKFFQKIKSIIKEGIRKTKDFLYEPVYYLGLAKRLSQDEELMLRFTHSFAAESLEDSDIFLLRFDWDNPDFAAAAVNTYAEEYFKHHIQVHESGQSHKFYIDQIGIYEAKLRDVENELQNFISKQNIYNIPLQKQILLTDTAALENKHNDAIIDSKNVTIKIQKIKKMGQADDVWVETPSIGKLGSEHTDLRKLDEAFFNLKNKRNELSGFFLPHSREIQIVDQQLKQLREQKTESLLNLLAVENNTVASKIKLLVQEISDKRAHLDKLNSLTLRLEQLERTHDIVKKNYLLYKNKAEELRISGDLNQSQIVSVKVVSPATPPLLPAYPKKTLILGIAAFLGLFCGFGYASLRQYFDHTFKNEDEVADYLQVPVLTTVPDFNYKLGNKF